LGIVTKSGDDGKTALLGGERVSKSSTQVEAYGTIDELNSFIGFAISLSEEGLFVKELVEIQRDLNLISSHLALSEKASNEIKKVLPPFEEDKFKKIENIIESLESQIPPLNNFILYGGHKFAAILQVLRCIARRAERRVVELNEKKNVEKNIIIYLNRLSDLLFLMARSVNHHFKVEEKLWKKE